MTYKSWIAWVQRRRKKLIPEYQAGVAFEGQNMYPKKQVDEFFDELLQKLRDEKIKAHE